MLKRHLRHKLSALLFACMAVCTVSCKKNIAGITPPDQDSATSMSQVFQDYWTGMNNNYVFWDIDTTNWDNVHRTYVDSFAILNINSRQDMLTAYRYLQQMTKGLIDGHYNISFYNPNLIDSSINPAVSRKKNIFPALTGSFFENVVLNNYLDKDSGYYANVSFNDTIGGKAYPGTLEIVTGTIHQHTAYLRLNEFFLADLIVSHSTLATAWNKFLGHLHDPDLNSVIVDVRSNPGGYIDDLNFICGQMIDDPLHFAYTKEKSGNGRLDYTPWADAIVTPAVCATAITVPIIVLTDQNSVSMAEMTTMALKTLPNTYIIGDTTWGANGPLSPDFSLFGGGQFNFGGFGYVYTSSAEYKYINL
jgi:carboxyl-terminal processing protease